MIQFSYIILIDNIWYYSVRRRYVIKHNRGSRSMCCSTLHQKWFSGCLVVTNNVLIVLLSVIFLLQEFRLCQVIYKSVIGERQRFFSFSSLCSWPGDNVCINDSVNVLPFVHAFIVCDAAFSSFMQYVDVPAKCYLCWCFYNSQK